MYFSLFCGDDRREKTYNICDKVAEIFKSHIRFTATYILYYKKLFFLAGR